MEKKNKNLLAKYCFWYTVVFFLLNTIGDMLLSGNSINWKGNVIQAILFGIFMTAFDYYSMKNGWFGRKKE